eukprot:scaffold7351_cov259-Pinguiococcus_pyrenoidosus.AAC.1
MRSLRVPLSRTSGRSPSIFHVSKKDFPPVVAFVMSTSSGLLAEPLTEVLGAYRRVCWSALRVERRERDLRQGQGVLCVDFGAPPSDGVAHTRRPHERLRQHRPAKPQAQAPPHRYHGLVSQVPHPTQRIQGPSAPQMGRRRPSRLLPQFGPQQQLAEHMECGTWNALAAVNKLCFG